MGVGLGIDTGGTYTDCVLVDRDTGDLLSESKALTTRQDLVIGISGAISKLNRSLFDRIDLVSLSSTLATNTIVEGKGCRVGAIAIGRRYSGTVRADMEFSVSGSHDLDGNEDVPLDESAVAAALEEMRGRVDSVAITGYLAIRNPEHEERVAAMAREMLDVVAVQGHDLSSGLGFHERMLTAIMNARLIPVIENLIESVRVVLADLMIRAPLMIVKGDGTIMSADVAALKPVETVLSGPASSLTGARALTGCRDAIMIDIGGTTTDIGVLRNGIPRLEPEGALIEGHRTRVLAASISTYGIGGDSRIIVNGKTTILTPVRVIPLCIAASKWLHVLERLRCLADAKVSHMAESCAVPEMHQDTEFFIASRPRTTEVLKSADERLLGLIRDSPLSLTEAGEQLGIHPYDFDVAKMERLGLVTRIGMTPTDLLHAEGSYIEYNDEASKLGALYLARKAQVSLLRFIADTKEMVERKIAVCLMNNMILDETGRDSYDAVCEHLVDMAISRRDGEDFGVAVRLNKPIIGIGAPVAAWLPEVAEIFGTGLILPEHSDVGNAIGAITGSVSQTSSALVKPLSGSTAEDPPCSVFTADGRREFGTMSEGLEFAERETVRTAREAAMFAGATNIVTETKRREKSYGSSIDENSHIVLEVEVSTTATGKPALADHRSRSAFQYPPADVGGFSLSHIRISSTFLIRIRLLQKG